MKRTSRPNAKQKAAAPHKSSWPKIVFLLLGVIGICAALAGMLYPRRAVDTAAPVPETKHYVASEQCTSCHRPIAESFRKTAMGQSFYLPANDTATARDTFQAKFFHAASKTWFAMEHDSGKLYQKRWQIGSDGKPTNVDVESVDYVMGAGTHVKAYLHRDAVGTLTELPLAWYTEGSGTWAMNPGFDNPHPPTRHKIAYECIFCHNAYPAIPQNPGDTTTYPVYSGDLPQGIDCQRCHGPGSAHIAAALDSNSTLEIIRGNILNPARLPANRQMDVCMQCHLEVTSRHLPDRIRSFDRPPFSYTPDQPLAEFVHYFQRDTGGKPDDTFEIVSVPYRLRQSKCFLKSGGALTCELCHNPHEPHQTPAAKQHYNQVCLGCHKQPLQTLVDAKKHTTQPDCTGCHMPQRRTDDVVHVTMTDHLIQRIAAPATVRLAPKREVAESSANEYRGPVLPYELAGGTVKDEDLYLATAQVEHDSNSATGIPALMNLIASRKPSQPDFSIELGDALRRKRFFTEAAAAYRDALSVDPHSLRARRSLGIVLASSGDTAQAITELRTGLEEYPSDPLLWYHLGWVKASAGQYADAITNFEKAIQLDPTLAEAYENLGIANAILGNTKDAGDAMQQALRIDPYDAGFQENLRKLVASQR